MICFRDMTFCSDAKNCANSEGCSRYLGGAAKEQAVKWWGSTDYPVAMSSFKDTCKKWEEKK